MFTQTAIYQGPESYTDYLVTAKFTERLHIIKQAAQKSDETLNLKKLMCWKLGNNTRLSSPRDLQL